MKRLNFLLAALVLSGGAQYRMKPPGSDQKGDEKDPRFFDEAGNQKTFAPDPETLDIERPEELNNSEEIAEDTEDEEED